MPSVSTADAANAAAKRRSSSETISQTPKPSRNQTNGSCRIDRKSTRLNSSHSQISYAVFCLKTKQIVVTKTDIGALETKIRRCQDAGVKAVVMCALHLKTTKHHLPDLWSMSKIAIELKKKHP